MKLDSLDTELLRAAEKANLRYAGVTPSSLVEGLTLVMAVAREPREDNLTWLPVSEILSSLE